MGAACTSIHTRGLIVTCRRDFSARGLWLSDPRSRRGATDTSTVTDMAAMLTATPTA